jgi:cysteine-rich CWC protein
MRLRDFIFRPLRPVTSSSWNFRGRDLPMNPDVDPHRCPLCGGTNDCAVAHGRGNCWCFTRPIPDAVLERIPEQARERACVCTSCAFGKRDPAKAFQRMAEILRRRNGIS